MLDMMTNAIAPPDRHAKPITGWTGCLAKLCVMSVAQKSPLLLRWGPNTQAALGPITVLREPTRVRFLPGVKHFPEMSSNVLLHVSGPCSEYTSDPTPCKPQLPSQPLQTHIRTSKSLYQSVEPRVCFILGSRVALLLKGNNCYLVRCMLHDGRLW